MYFHAIEFLRGTPSEAVREALAWAPELGWKYEEQLWIGPLSIAVPKGGAVWILEEPKEAAVETRMLLGLLRFVGEPHTKLHSRLTLKSMEEPCRRLQALGLPIDPFFVLERELHLISGTKGKFLLEVPLNADPLEHARRHGLQGRWLDGRLSWLPARAWPYGNSGVYRIPL